MGASLGADSIAAGKKAALLGLMLVVLFMFAAYGLFGLFANIALLINIALIFGVLSLIGSTLTLPGIAGIVLTMGIAVDANVLINRAHSRGDTRGQVALCLGRGGLHAGDVHHRSTPT